MTALIMPPDSDREAFLLSLFRYCVDIRVKTAENQDIEGFYENDS